MISVIVPVYNVEKYLARCIDSILNQTFADFELILVDDGSPDNCGRICDEYANKDKRIHVIHQKNGGLSAARNAGIDYVFANSTSEWITFVDSDDWIHPQMLETLYYANIQNNTNVSICGYKKVDNDFFCNKKPSVDITVVSPIDFYVKYNANATVAWGKLYRKDCFRELRYPKGKLHEDEFVTYKILFMYSYISVTNSPLYFYFFNETGIMNSEWSQKRLAAFDAIEQQIEFFKTLKCEDVVINRIDIYLITAYNQYMLILKANIQNKNKYLRLIKKNAKKIISKYRKTANIRVKTKPYIYEMLYPNCMKIYWTYNGILTKIKKNLIILCQK